VGSVPGLPAAPEEWWGRRLRRCRQLRDAQQVVRGGEDIGGDLVGSEADEASLAEVADGLDPAEDLLDSLAHALANGVADVPGRPLVDVRVSPLGDVLRDVRRDDALATVLDEVARVIALVAGDGDAAPAG
jgi:hypothetical protein